MNSSKQSASRAPAQESDTLRILRMKFHNYSKSQQISSVRPSAENTMKSTLKENDNAGWRQTMKSPMKNDSRYGLPAKYALTQKVNNVGESEFTRKARELLARSLTKKIQTPAQSPNIIGSPGPSPAGLPAGLGPSSAQLHYLSSSSSLQARALPPTARLPPPEKRVLTSPDPPRLQVPHDHRQGRLREGVGGDPAQPEDLLRPKGNVQGAVA